MTAASVDALVAAVAAQTQEVASAFMKAIGDGRTVSIADIVGRKNTKEIAIARRDAMAVLVNAGFSQQRVAELFGRAPTAVTHAVAKAARLRHRTDAARDDVTTASVRRDVAAYLLEEADRLHREGHPAALEVERLAGEVRRGAGPGRHAPSSNA